jgi:hypothetical protein
MVRVRKGSTVLHQENRTFAHRSAALTWAKHREVALEDPSALVRARQGAPTLGELIRWYIDNFENVSKWQRSKQAHLKFLERHALGKSNLLKLTATELIDHVRSRRAGGAGPATVANDLIWVGVVLRAAKNVKGLLVQPEVVQAAREACAELRLTGKARKRARRPTPVELEQLRDYFARRDKRAKSTRSLNSHCTIRGTSSSVTRICGRRICGSSRRSLRLAVKLGLLAQGARR